jgi:hypothetical protein
MNNLTLDRLALEIVLAIERKWPHLNWDSDEAQTIIWSMLPTSLAEAQAEWNEFMKELPPIKRPSLMERLKSALDLPEEATVKQTLELAIMKLKG